MVSAGFGFSSLKGRRLPAEPSGAEAGIRGRSPHVISFLCWGSKAFRLLCREALAKAGRGVLGTPEIFEEMNQDAPHPLHPPPSRMCRDRSQRPRRSDGLWAACCACLCERFSRLQSPTRYVSDVVLKGALCEPRRWLSA